MSVSIGEVMALCFASFLLGGGPIYLYHCRSRSRSEVALTILEFANHGLACRGVQDAYSTCSEVVYRLVSFHLQSSREEGMAYTTFIDQFTPKCGNKSVRGIPME